jgi:hypothetical protein
MTRARDIADQQDNLGGAVAPYVAGKNKLINGNFDFFQRTSFSQSTEGYSLDRWVCGTNGATVTQQTTGVPIGSRYCMRVAYNGSAYANIIQYIETSNCADLWGQTATMSYKLRRSSTYTGSLSVWVQKSATVNAGSGATWTTISSINVTNANLPTGTTSADWFSGSFPLVVPNDGTANSLRVLVVDPGGAASQYWEIAQFQLEAGSVATPFSRAGGSIGGELALCQRYYWRQTATGSAYTGFGTLLAVLTNTAQGSIPLPVALRVPATSVEYANLATYDNTVAAVTSLSLVAGATTSPQINVNSTTYTQFRPYQLLANNSTSAYLAFSAEL